MHQPAQRSCPPARAAGGCCYGPSEPFLVLASSLSPARSCMVCEQAFCEDDLPSGHELVGKPQAGLDFMWLLLIQTL